MSQRDCHRYERVICAETSELQASDERGVENGADNERTIAIHRHTARAELMDTHNGSDEKK